MPRVLAKRIRLTSSTIFPPLLSIADQADVETKDDWEIPLLPWAKDSTTSDLGVAESAYAPNDILGELGWHHNEDQSLDNSSTPCTSDDHFFSLFLHACSSPTSSASPSGVYSDETTGAKQISDEDFDDDLNFDKLFGQYLRSPSPLPSSPLKGVASELSGITLTNTEPNGLHDPAELSTKIFDSPAPEGV